MVMISSLAAHFIIFDKLLIKESIEIKTIMNEKSVEPIPRETHPKSSASIATVFIESIAIEVNGNETDVTRVHSL
jgi:hypothetical protein